MTQTNKVCIFAAPLCVAWSLTMCLVLALSHIKSPQPEVSEYAWALCYPPSPWHIIFLFTTSVPRPLHVQHTYTYYISGAG